MNFQFDFQNVASNLSYLSQVSFSRKLFFFKIFQRLIVLMSFRFDLEHPLRLLVQLHPEALEWRDFSLRKLLAKSVSKMCDRILSAPQRAFIQFPFVSIYTMYRCPFFDFRSQFLMSRSRGDQMSNVIAIRTDVMFLENDHRLLLMLPFFV
jgi:hypothetical protein